MAAISAVDAIKPAIDRTRRELFQPFRFKLWMKFAFLGLFTGELSSGGGAPNFNFHLPARSTPSGNFAAAAPFHMPSLAQLLPWIVLAAFTFVIIFLVMLWVSSTLRFVLFESVITGDVQIRAGWRRWNVMGNRLFAWRLIYTLTVMAAWAVLVGLPLLAAWRAGILRSPREHVLVVILGGLILGAVAVVLGIATLVIWVLTKDFVVPMMAAEGIGPVESWRRLLRIMQPSKGNYAGYAGMKAVLALAGGLTVAIVVIVLVVILLIPFIIVAALAGIMSAGGGIAWSALTITFAIIAGMVLAAILVCVVASISVPLVVFFQSYALHFFAPRYEPLAQWMWPMPPPAAPPLTTA